MKRFSPNDKDSGNKCKNASANIVPAANAIKINKNLASKLLFKNNVNAPTNDIRLIKKTAIKITKSIFHQLGFVFRSSFSNSSLADLIFSIEVLQFLHNIIDLPIES